MSNKGKGEQKVTEKKAPKCYCCGLVDAEVKDYRTFDDITGKYLVCRFCMGINDVYFRKIHYEEDPVEKRLLVRAVLLEEFWEQYGVTDEDIERITDTRENVISWQLVVYWNNGEREVITDIPDWASKDIDNYIAEIEAELKGDAEDSR